MKYSILALTVAALASSTTALLPILNEEMTNLFDAYKKEFGHSFNSLVEEERSLLVFIDNMEMITAHNKRFEAGEETYSLSLNQYAHITAEQFREMNMKFKLPEDRVSTAAHIHEAPSVGTFRGSRNLAAAGIDWREHGAVTPVKNQGSCGSCWTFSTTGAVEGAHFLATGELVSLSEQQLLNCVRDGAWTCDTGGVIDWGFQYIVDVGGIVKESDMPYENVNGGAHGACPFTSNYMGGSNMFGASISSFVDIGRNDEAGLADALLHQPVAIAIDASARSFQFYSSGVYDPDTCCEYGACTPRDLDHAVLAVGFGTDEVTGEEYWIVKNSWGATWGDEGFVKMVKGKGSKCGVATVASYPRV